MVINSKLFSWNPKARTLATEVSSIGLGYGVQELSILSEKTGCIADFKLAERHRNVEGELTHWELRPTLESLRINPRLDGMKVLVFND